MSFPKNEVPSWRNRAEQAFTIAELLVAVSLLSMIVLALYTMFNQTQRALRANVTQVDILEAGRAAMELITRDIEQASFADVYKLNMFGRNYREDTPLVQALPATGTGAATQANRRTNYLQALCFLTRSNDFLWMANSYFVATPTNPTVRVGQRGYGTLYRYSSILGYDTNRPGTNRLSPDPFWSIPPGAQLSNQATNTNYVVTAIPLIPGVVHLRWLPYDSAGRLMTYRGYKLYTNEVILEEERQPPGETSFYFFSEPSRHFTNALPSYLELELGLLEPQVVEQLKSFLDPNRARSYLTNQARRVHLFRQRIPIRTVPR